MQLSIVSLNYKKPQLTKESMDSLWQQYKKEFEKGLFEYIVVDNNSMDDSVAVLKQHITTKKYRNFSVIANKENAGFGAGNNTGVKKAKGNYILFLNNDTQVKDEGIIGMLALMEERKDIAILGGKVTNFDGTEQVATGKFYTPLSILLLLLGMQRIGLIDKNPQSLTNVDWVKGAMMMIRKDVFEKLHGFDEHIFMYTEDMELCFRAKKQAFSCYFYPNISVLHKDQGSSNRTFAIVHIYKNLLYFYSKHGTKIAYYYVKSMLYIKAALLVVVGKILNNTYLVTTYEQALAVLR